MRIFFILIFIFGYFTSINCCKERKMEEIPFLFFSSSSFFTLTSTSKNMTIFEFPSFDMDGIPPVIMVSTINWVFTMSSTLPQGLVGEQSCDYQFQIKRNMDTLYQWSMVSSISPSYDGGLKIMLSCDSSPLNCKADIGGVGGVIECQTSCTQSLGVYDVRVVPLSSSIPYPVLIKKKQDTMSIVLSSVECSYASTPLLIYKITVDYSIKKV